MTHDLIKELGYLAFGSRLRRLTDKVSRDVQRIYEHLDVDFNPRWFPITQALMKYGQLNVTTLASYLDITHTAVNQITTEMIKNGMVESFKDPEDERARLLKLSPKGEKTAEELIPVWGLIRYSITEIVEASGVDFLAALESVEKSVDAGGVFERVAKEMKFDFASEVEILDYRPAYKKYFKSLNVEWLEEYFDVEAPDMAVLDDPNGKIIRKGGKILFARLGEEILGTCALVRFSDDIVMLEKMAVTSRSRGKGIGRELMDAALEKAREMGAEEIYLMTSPLLKPAIRLYENTGFERTNKYPAKVEGYKRETFVMKKSL